MADSSFQLRDPQGAIIALKLSAAGDGTYLVATAMGTAGAPVKWPLSNTQPTQLSEFSSPCRQVMLMGDPLMVGAYVSIGTLGTGNQVVPLGPGQVMFLPLSNVNQLYGLAQTDQDAVIYWPFN